VKFFALLFTFRSALLLAAFGLAACGKATVKLGATAEGFSLASLRSGTVALLVESEVAFSGLTPTYDDAFADRFGTGDSLSSYLSARLLDSLNGGAPRISAAPAPALNPRHILVVRDLALARGERELPTTLLPAVGQNSMQAAGGGASQSWTFSFGVQVWEVASRLPEDGVAADSGNPGIIADTANGLLRHSFRVTATADVPLYAYEAALVETINVAASKATRHLRDL
jgi:hypothetical protein